MFKGKLVQISSKDKIQSTQTTSDFTVNLDQHDLNIHRTHRVELVNAVIPNTEYNINTKNNTFDYNLTGTPTVYSVPVGIYTTDTLITALNAETTGVVWTQDALTDKITATTAGGVTFVATDQTLMDVLGFTSGIINIVAASAQTGSSLPDVNGLDIVYIMSRSLASNNGISSDGRGKDILSAVPIDIAFGSNQVFHSNTSSEDSSIIYAPHPIDISNIHIQIVDKNFAVCELNGHHVQLVFKIYYQYGQ